jgi:Cytochrome c554 and c-prime
MAPIRMALLLFLIGVFSTAIERAEQATPPPDAKKYAGDAACLSCHKDQSDSYLHTAHHLTSQPANKDSLLGSFREGSNVLMIADPAKAADDPGLYFKMEARDNGYYQTAVAGWPKQLQSKSEPIDVVIGSGVRGQSYLYWHGEQLFELPVSYWSDGNRWINSPGYKNGTMNFARAVTPRCLECHATYIEPRSLDPLTNRYNRKSLVVGISCERCHGPGAEHIALHAIKTSAGVPGKTETILNPAKFSRDRQVGLCALCHNGIRREEFAPAFSFVPGKPLDSYLQPNTGEIAAHPDVHGNQVGLLKQSRCYQSSPGISCSTCHDVHQPEHAAAAYSSRCLNCHQVESCGMSKSLGQKIADNCIDCHMPVEPTNAIVSETAGQVIRPSMRNHWIKVYDLQSPKSRAATNAP